MPSSLNYYIALALLTFIFSQSTSLDDFDIKKKNCTGRKKREKVMHSTVVITYFTGHKNAAKGVKGGRGAFIKGVKCGKIQTVYYFVRAYN